MSKRNLFAAVATIACLAQPAWAQDYPDSGDAVASDDGSWTGFYVGGRLGLSEAADENNETVLFDTNLDRTFGDAVRTGAGADAFSPGFCGGRALAPQAAVGCRGDRERTEYAGHVGFDYDLGGIVVGVIGEYARGGGRDSVTAFSTTPANYVLTRNLRDSFGLRARAGLDLGSTLIYGTGGGVYGRFRNRFSSSNVANAFQVNGGREEEFGYSFGGGVEQRFGPRFSDRKSVV